MERNADGKIDRITEICTHFDGVDTLYDRKKAQIFLDSSSMLSHGIKVVFQDYQHKPYKQLWGEFIPFLSVVDLLMNCGKESVKYVLTSKIR